jgi:SAM-dependent methyltransferase
MLLYTPKTKDQYPDPEEQALHDYFSNTLGWGDGLHSRATFEFLMEIRNFAAGGLVLDAGAGHKRFAPFFNNATYLTVEHPSGIEMKAMQGQTYDFIAELDGTPFAPEESFHAIYSHSVLEHIERPEKFFANSIKMLKPGGRLYTHCPFMYVEHETPYDFNRFTRYGLKSRLEEAGFRIIKLLPSSNAFYGASAFVTDAIAQDSASRAFQIESVQLTDGSSAPLFSTLTSIFKALNNAFDDGIYENTCPIGWLCVAEKPI